MSHTRTGPLPSWLAAFGTAALVSVLSACGGGDSPAGPVDGGNKTGSLALSISGLPSGTAAAVTVTSSDFSRSISASSTLRDLVPGAYTVTAASVTTGNQTYVPDPTTQQVLVVAGSSASSAEVTYAPSTASLTVSISGAPVGANGAVTVTGPGSYSVALTTTTTLSGLVPGAYTIAATDFEHGGRTYKAAPTTQQVMLTAGGTADAPIAYAAETHSLTVNVTGVPEGASADMTLTGPDGYSRTLDGTATVTGLLAGEYTLWPDEIRADGHVYTPDPTGIEITLADGQSQTVAVSYYLNSGAIAIQVSGLPEGVEAKLTLSGLGGFSRSITGTQTITGLAPGKYTVTATAVTSGSRSYAPAPATLSVSVSVSLTPSPAVIVYTEQ